MIHILYKTTNLINQKFYIGMHSTKNKDDGYLGSGKIVLQAIKKYGRENFKKEILAICESRSQLAALEKTIISESLLKDPLCMNLKVGGEGGGLAGSGCGMPIGYKHSHVTKQKISIAGRGRVFGPLSEKRKLQISENRRGHKHTDVSKKAISEAYHIQTRQVRHLHHRL
jgi:group I intron endonuclease